MKLPLVSVLAFVLFALPSFGWSKVYLSEQRYCFYQSEKNTFVFDYTYYSYKTPHLNVQIYLRGLRVNYFV